MLIHLDGKLDCNGMSTFSRSYSVRRGSDIGAAIAEARRARGLTQAELASELGVGRAYLAAMDQVVLPALHAFKPSMIVVASGYDAGYFDPMSHMLLLANHFRQFTQRVMKVASELCGGRLVINHEGGYSDFYVPLCGLAVIEELAGISTSVRDPYAGTEYVANQALMPHQQEYIDRAKRGPLAALLARC